MNKAKIAITIDKNIINDLDRLIKVHFFENRSKAIQEAIEEKLERIKKSRLIRECEKLDREFEKSLAEQRLSEEVDRWPEY